MIGQGQLPVGCFDDLLGGSVWDLQDGVVIVGNRNWRHKAVQSPLMETIELENAFNLEVLRHDDAEGQMVLRKGRKFLPNICYKVRISVEASVLLVSVFKQF